MDDSTASLSSTVCRSVLSRRRLMMSVGRGSIHCKAHPSIAQEHGQFLARAPAVLSFSMRSLVTGVALHHM